MPAILARTHDRARCERLVLHGGDDYELLFTVPPGCVREMEGAVAAAGCTVTCIGEITATTDVVCRRDGRIENAPGSGYDHFAG